MIVCGDHGMADQGGHGGVTHNEVSTPMIFLSDSKHFVHGKDSHYHPCYRCAFLSVAMLVPYTQKCFIGVFFSCCYVFLRSPSNLGVVSSVVMCK